MNRNLFTRHIFLLMMATMVTFAQTSFAKDDVKPTAKTIAAPSPLKVVTTLSVIASITKEIGGDLIKVDNLAGAAEDPHFVKAKPSLNHLVREADLFMLIGRSLDDSWSQLLIDVSTNEKLIGKTPIAVSAGVKTLEVPTEVTRKKGDIHLHGNPHVWLSALGGLKMAENIKNALSTARPQHKEQFQNNFLGFKDRLSKALFGEELIKIAGNADYLWRLHEGKKLKDYVAKKKKTLGGWLLTASQIDYSFITYHPVWSYLVDEFDLKFFGTIEENAGVAPTPKYLNDLVKRAKAAHVTHIFDASFYVGFSKDMDFVAEEIGGRKIFIDADCVGDEKFIDMMNRIFKSLVDFKNPPAPPAPAKPVTPKKK